MRTKKRRKPKLTKAELYEISSGLDGIGDLLVMTGELAKREKEMKNIDKLMRKLFRADDRGLISVIENNPELIDKANALAQKWGMLTSAMEKDPDDMEPEEQIEAGESLKDFSSLLKEIAEGMGND
ncbi:hypothetical protein C5S53_03385 [Methanophagales archaeon]|nr:hypothetical protein C5S53_03385 [Methanophagales archaeon]